MIMEGDHGMITKPLKGNDMSKLKKLLLLVVLIILPACATVTKTVPVTHPEPELTSTEKACLVLKRVSDVRTTTQALMLVDDSIIDAVWLEDLVDNTISELESINSITNSIRDIVINTNMCDGVIHNRVSILDLEKSVNNTFRSRYTVIRVLASRMGVDLTD